MIEHDCQCNYCKNHSCNVISGPNGMRCSNINCEFNSINLIVTIEDKKRIIGEFLDFIKRNIKMMSLLSGYINPTAEKEMAIFLDLQKDLYIKKEKTIQEDL